MELVIGKEHASAVLTIIERSTNMFFQSKLESKQPDIIQQADLDLIQAKINRRPREKLKLFYPKS